MKFFGNHYYSENFRNAAFFSKTQRVLLWNCENFLTKTYTLNYKNTSFLKILRYTLYAKTIWKAVTKFYRDTSHPLELPNYNMYLTIQNRGQKIAKPPAYTEKLLRKANIKIFVILQICCFQFPESTTTGKFRDTRLYIHRENFRRRKIVPEQSLSFKIGTFYWKT